VRTVDTIKSHESITVAVRSYGDSSVKADQF